MIQKFTKRIRLKLQPCLLLTVTVILSLIAHTSFAQSTACACTNSTANLLTNASFENGSKGWSVSGGSLTFGSTYAVCGSKNAFLNFNCSSAKVWQKVTSVSAGSTVTFKAWAGTHTRGISCSPRLTLYFYNSSNTLLKSAYVTVDKDVDKPDYKLKEYTITAVAPAGTYYTKVEGSIGCNTLKLDAMCLTTSTTVSQGSIGDKVWYDANSNGLQDANEVGIPGVSVQLKNASNAVIATTTTNSTGIYTFGNLSAGCYTVVFPTSLYGAPLASKNVGSNRDIDSDPSQSTGATATITLSAGQNITNVDAGYCANIMSLGNRVWYDANNNGFDDNESGIANVKLNLYKDDNNDNVADGAAIATTTTDNTGYYLFRNLLPGNYIVGAVTPAGYTSSTVNGGDPDNNINLDDNGQVTAGTETRGLAITLSMGSEPGGSCNNGNSNTTYDFGFYKVTVPSTSCDCTTSTSNLLTNASFENGSTGWSVSGGTITTGTGYVICGSKNAFLNQSSGTAKAWQQVTSIVPGSIVVFKGWSGTHTPGISCSPKLTLSFYTSASVLISSTSVTVDKDVDKADYKLKEYTVTALAPAGTYYTRVEGSIGCNVLKLDALCLTATPPVTGCLGDKVFTDLNANGIQDDGEPGIPGVKVTLTYPNSTTASATTDNNGEYKFCGLPAGTYSIAFGNPGGQYIPTISNAGSDDSKDSDPINGVVAGISLEAGETNLTIDAGFILKNLNLGNLVWYDQNANGIQDAGETGVGGVTVNLYSDADSDNVADGAAIATTTTNAAGQYGFGALAPGKYIVGVVLPAGYDPTIVTATSDAPDNDNDTDNNGVLTTSAEVFSNAISLSNATEPTTDGDGNNGNLTLDFGLIGEATLGDFIWNDLNANGVQDAAEPGIAGVTVTLTFPNGGTATTTTDANGAYLFSNLAPGTYSVSFAKPAGYNASPSNTGSDDTKDSDPVNGVVSGIVLAAGDNNLTVDAGFYSSNLNLGNYVWFDQNNNGIQDAGETAISGATVNLYADVKGDNVADGAAIATTTTDANGLYGFGSLAPGKYIVGVVMPAGYSAAATTASSATPDNDDNTDNNGVSVVAGELRSNAITLAGGSEPATDGDGNNGNLTLDFGLTGLGSIGDFVWHDFDANGIQDSNEPGRAGIIVKLTYPNGATSTFTTGGDGKYLFSNLPAGNYVVSFSAPDHFFLTLPNVGSDDTKDSDPVNGSVTVALGAGENNMTIDAGVYCDYLSVGNYVWYDQNNNGIQDATEPGISGATVNLYRDNNGDNVPDGTAIATTVTDANGIYSFPSIMPGKYIVGVTVPAGYAAGATTAGSATPDNDDNTDNNGVTMVGGELRSNYITLITTMEPINDGDNFNGNTTLDFGLKGTGSIGDFVWHDLDANGIQDAGEPGRKDITVTLTYPNGATANFVTLGDGKYLFSNLAPGNYSVSFSAPDHFYLTLPNVGSDDTKDSDPVNGVANVTLGAGENNMTIDAGLYCDYLSVGDFVWYDQNNNGIQDAGEQGISGATVNLYRDNNGDNLPDGAAIMTVTTNASGIYRFPFIMPGKYIVGVVVPAGYAAGATTAGSATPDNDNNTDNDGVTMVGGELRSNSITLITTLEPTDDGDNFNGNNTLDFGLKGTGAIGDYVWHDLDANGLQDKFEIGYGRKDITVTLTYPNGATATYVTLGDGRYLFSNLAPGNYSVAFSSPDHFFLTLSNVGSDDTIDSDPVNGVVNVTLGAGENNMTIDAGLYCDYLSIGNLVWNDQNKNGIQDAGEPGIAGATVKLYRDNNTDNVPDGPAVMTVTTNASGIYSFPFIMAGKYIVGVTVPSGYVPGATTATSATPDNDNNTDNNGVTLVAGELRSNFITLITTLEPIDDGDNFNGNTTMDFALNVSNTAARSANSTTKAPAAASIEYQGFNIQQVYPNPFADKITLSYTSEKVQKVGIRILDNAGKVVYSVQSDVQKGKNTIQLTNLGRNAAGSYIVELKTATGVFIKQIMK